MIYLILNQEQGACKIGHSQNPKVRLARLQTATPNTLELIATLPGGLVEEQQAHTLFASERIGGEWFQTTAEIFAYFNATPDAGRYINVATDALAAMSKMGDTTRKVLVFVQQQMQVGSQEIALPKSACMEACQFKQPCSFHKGVKELVAAKFITRQRMGIYSVNSDFLFRS